MSADGTDGRRHIADVITLGNAMCGTGAVLIAAASPLGPYGDTLRPVALLLLFGTIFDVFDGAAARRWGSTLLGRTLDSQADLISFGVAPAVALAVPGVRASSGALRIFVVVAALVYVAGAIRRLAIFTVTPADEEHRFTGLPSPTAALVVLALAFLTESQAVAATGLLLTGILMVGRFPYPGQQGAVPAITGLSWVVGLLALAGTLNARLVAALFIAGAVALPLLSLLRGHAAHTGASGQPHRRPRRPLPGRGPTPPRRPS